MQTRLVMLLIKKVLRRVVFMWVIILSPGWIKSKIPSHYPLLRLSTPLPVAIAPNFYGYKNSSLIMVFIKNILPSIVTIPVPLTSLGILFNILWTKHIEIWHHFIQELVKDGTLTLEFIHTNDQKTDLFTKPLESKWFEFLCQNIGVISMEWSLLLLLLPHAFASSFMFCFVYHVFVYLFSVLLYFFFIKKKLKNQKNTKTMCVLCTLVLVYLGWPLKQSFLNFVSFVT